MSAPIKHIPRKRLIMSHGAWALFLLILAVAVTFAGRDEVAALCCIASIIHACTCNIIRAIDAVAEGKE